MAEFQVRGELDALSGADVGVGHKYHVCDWAARENDATEQLADEVETAVLVGDSHDDTNRYKENAGDQ